MLHWTTKANQSDQCQKESSLYANRSFLNFQKSTKLTDHR